MSRGPTLQFCICARVALIFGATTFLTARPAVADQGGVSFWLPGTFGSLAATPLQPGWSWTTLYLHSSVSAGGDVAASRAIKIPADRTVNLSVDLNAQIKAAADATAFGPTYVFATPILGGQFAITGLAMAGRQHANID